MAKRRTHTPPELDDVASLVGDFIEYWGFKHVHGRIWVHLYLSPEPLDAGQLQERLAISKALASMSLSELMEFDVVLKAGKGERGTLTYKANPKVVSVITNVLRKRERRLLTRVAAASRLLTNLPADGIELDKSRTQTLIKMTEKAEQALEGMLSLGEIELSGWEKFDGDLSTARKR